jgi:TonB family protein
MQRSNRLSIEGNMRRILLAILLQLMLLAGLDTVVQATAVPDAAQSNTPSEEPVVQNSPASPSDPAALVHAAQKVNGLTGQGLPARHIRVSYQIVDRTLSPDSGTYEEWWITDHKYKRTYSSSLFSQTDFGTEQGLFRMGNQNWPGPLELTVQTALMDPIPATLNFQGMRLENKRRSIDKANFQCVTLTGDWIFLVANAYCFESDKPILRYTAAFGDRNSSWYNGIVSFGGHFIARDITVTRSGKPQIILHVELLEGLAAVDDSEFTPPTNAVHISSGAVSLPRDTAQAFLLRQVPPHYPPTAKTAHIQGTVVLQVTIGRDGRVTAAHATSGPGVLKQEAADAVLKWEYRPFLICGEPVEVETEVPVTFTLGG